MTDNPFAMLGLPVTAQLSDDDVRAAWRRIAASTHPDREDGGDPDRFGSAAAAYMQLRTSFGRGEALADLGGGPAAAGRRPRHSRRGRRGAHRARLAGPSSAGPSPARGSRWHRRGQWRPGRRRQAGGLWPAGRLWLAGRWRRQAGRRWQAGSGWWPRRAGRGLLLRVGCAAAAAVAAVAVAGLTPATIGLLAGALTVAAWALWRQGGLGRR